MENMESGDTGRKWGRRVSDIPPPPGLANSPPDGVHYLIEFFGCSLEQINSQLFWEATLANALNGAEVRILNRNFYQFQPYGITGYVLISASHISVHTWPEHGYVACDVFSCGSATETETIVNRIRDAISHERTQITSQRRGYRFEADSDGIQLPAVGFESVKCDCNLE